MPQRTEVWQEAPVKRAGKVTKAESGDGVTNQPLKAGPWWITELVLGD
jgi:hypothetical protein